MELNREIVTTPLRPAATVVMLRDAPGGLEVFLMKRHINFAARKHIGAAQHIGQAVAFHQKHLQPTRRIAQNDHRSRRTQRCSDDFPI